MNAGEVGDTWIHDIGACSAQQSMLTPLLLLQLLLLLLLNAGEVGDTWIHGIGADPGRMADYRAVLRARRECEASEKCDSQVGFRFWDDGLDRHHSSPVASNLVDCLLDLSLLISLQTAPPPLIIACPQHHAVNCSPSLWVCCLCRPCMDLQTLSVCR
jgi:hypothetical protein